MKFRNLRIAWSVAWGLAAVLLVVLWVRSFWWVDGINGPVTSKYYLGLGSVPGSVGGSIVSRMQGPSRSRWTMISMPSDEWVAQVEQGRLLKISRLWGAFYFGPLGYIVPDWFCVLIATSIAAIPWVRGIKWQYSLRTLLIAMTLIAMALGLIVWMSRAG